MELIIKPTERCNFKCTFCSSTKLVDNKESILDLQHVYDFLTRFPKITLNLELAERFPDMTQEQVDLIFGVSIVGPEHLIQKKIATTRYVLAGSPEYFKKHGLNLGA